MPERDYTSLSKLKASDGMMSRRKLGDVAAEAMATFGTSGVRARVANLTPELCWAYTNAFLSLPDCPRAPVLIAHDLRPSSPAIASVCHASARQLGFETIYAGAVPTPALAFAAQERGSVAIMVTGSHIPFDWNGIKFYGPSGEITKADEKAILNCPMPKGTAKACVPLPEADSSILEQYLDRYRQSFLPDCLKGLRIGVYEHSSVARDLLHALLRSLGAVTISLARTDGFVAVDTEAVAPEDREIGPVWVREYQLDAVITTDGDADRPLVADENGSWLRGDLLGLICAVEIGASTVVTPITSTTALEKSGCFAEVIRTRVGSPHVIAAMQQSRSKTIVGYEANGGVLLGSEVVLPGGRLSALPTRDAILPILVVLSAACRSGCSVSALTKKHATRHSFSDRIQNVDLQACGDLIAQLNADPAAIERLLDRSLGVPHAVDRTDGLRITLGCGDVIHVRLSGNAPELRCYTEAQDPERAEELCRGVLQAIESKIQR